MSNSEWESLNYQFTWCLPVGCCALLETCKMLQFIKKAGTMQTIKQQIIRWPFFFRKMITLYSLFGFLYQRKTGMSFGWKSKCAIHDIAFNALLRVFFSLLSYRSAFSLSCCCVADFIRVETHPTTCFLYTKLTCFGFSLGFCRSQETHHKIAVVEYRT